jgi:hypothetical protein
MVLIVQLCSPTLYGKYDDFLIEYGVYIDSVPYTSYRIVYGVPGLFMSHDGLPSTEYQHYSGLW